MKKRISESVIHSILNQTYPADKFEIIVTDDHSTDNTVSVVESFKRENITLLHLSDFIEDRQLNSYKKKSIDTALQICKRRTDRNHRRGLYCRTKNGYETLAAFLQTKIAGICCFTGKIQ